MFERLASALERSAPHFQEAWPTSAQAFLPGGRVPAVEEVYAQKDLAGMVTTLVEAEYRERRRGRRESLQAAHDAFYKREIAERIIRFVGGRRLPPVTARRN